MKKFDTTKTIVILDTHAILHRAYHALPDFSSRAGEPTGALYGLSTLLIKIIRELKPDYFAACYDLPKPTFRHESYGKYKEGRAAPDDALIAQIKRSADVFAAFGIPTYSNEGFEADDIIGTIAEKTKKIKGLTSVIASGDMDTLQLVERDRVVVYTLKKGINDTLIYDEKAVVERFGFSPKLLPDYKGLRGDPSDNIPGIPGIGEKTATTLIKTFGSLEKIYQKLKNDESAFASAGIKPRIIALLKDHEEEAFFSKELGTIRRDALDTFSLPPEWSRSFDREAVRRLFTELEFRGLKDRLDGVLSGSKGEEKEGVKEDTTPAPDVSEERSAEAEEVKIALWVVNSDMTNPSLEDVFEHTGASTIANAKKSLLAELKELNLEKVYTDIELPLIPIGKAASKTGVRVDSAFLDSLSVEYHKKLSQLEKSIWAAAGHEFNINSPKQLGIVLFDELGLAVKGLKKTAGGARSTRESELMKLAGEHPIIDDLLAYREVKKLLSTYIDVLPKLISDDGRIHTTLNQAGTTTGRMSSTDPNMQNIPTGEGLGAPIRNAFIAGDGWQLVSFDYSQIEMRILAVLAEDEALMQIFRDGKDIHASVASRVFGVDEDEVTKDMRRRAKVINFGIVYGMGVNALRANLGGTRAEAQTFYDNYFKAFPKIAEYFDTVKSKARKNGYTTTFFGRRRNFHDLRSHIPYIRAAAERMAMNAPIQGTATADIIKIAMRKVDEAITARGVHEDVRLLLQIHDELIYEIREGKVEEVAKFIKKEMEDFPEIPIPLIVNVLAGKRWGEMKPLH